jgi:hypothetical protein
MRKSNQSLNDCGDLWECDDKNRYGLFINWPPKSHHNAGKAMKVITVGPNRATYEPRHIWLGDAEKGSATL